jgi:hypothetical protein
MLNPSFSTSARGVASFCSALVRRLVSPRWAANCTGSWLAIGGTARVPSGYSSSPLAAEPENHRISERLFPIRDLGS